MCFFYHKLHLEALNHSLKYGSVKKLLYFKDYPIKPNIVRYVLFPKRVNSSLYCFYILEVREKHYPKIKHNAVLIQ